MKSSSDSLVIVENVVVNSIGYRLLLRQQPQRLKHLKSSECMKEEKKSVKDKVNNFNEGMISVKLLFLSWSEGESLQG